MEVCGNSTCGDSLPPDVHRIRNWVGIRTSFDAGTRRENILGKQTAFMYPAAQAPGWQKYRKLALSEILLSPYFFGLKELSYTKMSRILLPGPNCVSPSGKQRGCYAYAEFRTDNVVVSIYRITSEHAGTYVTYILKLSEIFGISG
jgi:hypothetical protein